MFFDTVVLLISLAALLLAIASYRNSRNTPELIHFSAPGTENLNLPFAAAVQLEHTIYLSGNLGNIPGRLELVSGGIEAETRQTMENIGSALKAAGSSIDRVIKCTVFMAYIDEWQAMNEVYTTFFTVPPARSALAAKGLALDARVEIECIALAR